MSLSQVWIPPPPSLPFPPGVCVFCVRVVWTRRGLSSIPSSMSLTGPSRQAASLFPIDGTTAQLTPPQPCQQNPLLRPTICSCPHGGTVGNDLKKQEQTMTIKDNNDEK